MIPPPVKVKESVGRAELRAPLRPGTGYEKRVRSAVQHHKNAAIVGTVAEGTVAHENMIPLHVASRPASEPGGEGECRSKLHRRHRREYDSGRVIVSVRPIVAVAADLAVGRVPLRMRPCSAYETVGCRVSTGEGLGVFVKMIDRSVGTPCGCRVCRWLRRGVTVPHHELRSARQRRNLHPNKRFAGRAPHGHFMRIPRRSRLVGKQQISIVRQNEIIVGKSADV